MLQIEFFIELNESLTSLEDDIDNLFTEKYYIGFNTNYFPDARGYQSIVKAGKYLLFDATNSTKANIPTSSDLFAITDKNNHLISIKKIHYIVGKASSSSSPLVHINTDGTCANDMAIQANIWLTFSGIVELA